MPKTHMEQLSAKQCSTKAKEQARSGKWTKIIPKKCKIQKMRAYSPGDEVVPVGGWAPKNKDQYRYYVIGSYKTPGSGVFYLLRSDGKYLSSCNIQRAPASKHILAWNGGMTMKKAEEILTNIEQAYVHYRDQYSEQKSSELSDALNKSIDSVLADTPILADILEEAGYEDYTVLEALRTDKNRERLLRLVRAVIGKE